MESELRTSKWNPRRISRFAMLFFFTAVAARATPVCTDFTGNPLKPDNQTVLRWKSSTPNQYLGRAEITGTVQAVYPIRNGHNHFQVKIGPGEKDTLELVYNISFGPINDLVPGQTVVACGDYITSNAPTSQYEPSPDGAILHWIHRSPNPGKHPSGFLILDRTTYGQGFGSGSLE